MGTLQHEHVLHLLPLVNEEDEGRVDEAVGDEEDEAVGERVDEEDRV